MVIKIRVEVKIRPLTTRRVENWIAKMIINLCVLYARVGYRIDEELDDFYGRVEAYRLQFYYFVRYILILGIPCTN